MENLSTPIQRLPVDQLRLDQENPRLPVELQGAEDSALVRYLWDNTAAVQSKDVVGVLNGYYTTHDLTFTSVK